MLSSGTAHAMDDAYPAANTCDWPTTVFLVVDFDDATSEIIGAEQGGCTAAYVGNGMIVTAGHCINGSTAVAAHFGEDGMDPEDTVAGLDCLHHPGGEWHWVDVLGPDQWRYMGPDIAFCLLEPGHLKPPKLPIMVPNGCEADYIRTLLFGSGWDLVPATYVGMGTNDISCSPCDFGDKRYAEGDILYQRFSTYSQAQSITALQPDPDVSGGIIGIVPGDSGGPTNFEMANGTHRIIGTISKQGKMYLFLPEHPTEQVFYWGVDLTPTPIYLRWLEYNSGRDVTLCHTWNGTTNSWDFTGGAGCGAGYDVTPLGGPATTWSSTSTGVSACSASDMLASETACAGWLPWLTTPAWVAAYPPRSNGDGLVDLAVNGYIANKALFGATGLNEIYGSIYSDTLSGTLNADEFYLGEGDDLLSDAARGADQIHGGSGDDEIHGGAEGDIIHGSYGMDEVYGDGGNDTIVILGECEVEAGEIYDGGSGTDTLITPLTLVQLSTLGVTVSNFETIVTTHANAQASACDIDPDMKEVWAQLPAWTRESPSHRRGAAEPE